MTHTWSPYQLAYFDWIKHGTGNATLVAVAGAGKTTVLVEGSRYMAGSIASAMYNKKNVPQFETKLREAGLGSNQHRVGTFHSFGFSALRRAYPNAKLDDKGKDDRIAAELGIPDDVKEFSLSLLSLAKQAAIGLLRPEDDESAWWGLVQHHDLEGELEDPRLAAKGVMLARQALKLSRDISREVIDFDDMVYLPAVTNMRVWQNDWLLVDEAQDTNPARRALARKMLRPGGRAVFVGDPCQAIYGFTGADNDSLDLIKAEFGTETLPLTISYRCARAIVAEARTIVSHIEAHEEAPWGDVQHADYGDLLSTRKEGDDKRTPSRIPLFMNDAVLCRKTAPLVELAFKLIRDGVPCHVEGREIGGQLLKLVNRWKKVRTTDAFRECLEKHREDQVAKLMAKGSEAAADALNDRVETLLVLLEECGTLDELRTKIGRMFQDDVPTLSLSTVHKAKGREWDRVFLLGRESYMPSPWARQAWQQEQERNLLYVAITRAKKVLTYVTAPPEKKD